MGPPIPLLAPHSSPCSLAVPSPDKFSLPGPPSAYEITTPGELKVQAGKILLNKGRLAVRLSVSSKCDRPIQVRAC